MKKTAQEPKVTENPLYCTMISQHFQTGRNRRSRMI